MIALVEYSSALRSFSFAALAEGFCPYGHGRLDVVDLHGRRQGTCRPCGCSWYVKGGEAWGCACTPEDHTCGEGSL
jgi:hypothetical protein